MVAMIGRQSGGDDRILAAELFRLKLRPVYNLREELVNGIQHYKASGTDPQADLVFATTEKPLRIRAGLHRFVFEPHVTSGRITEPTLYIDHGKGFSEGQAIRLQETNPSLWSIDFDLAEDAVQVRFDPCVGVGSFIVLRLDLIYLYRTASRPIEGRWLYSASRKLLALTPKSWRETIDRTGTATRLFAEFFPNSLLTKITNARAMTSAKSLENFEDKHLRTYLHGQAVALGMRDASYAAIAADHIIHKETTFRPIAFYLPQMHPIPENVRWWSKGFTDWTNVSKAMPQFMNHYQPRLPGELGFYDLRCQETMYRQIELARLYGIYAFCFHYYWFDGHRLLERPIDMLLADKKMDFKFCLCWANENWTRRWDGNEQEILISQKHSEEDNLKVFQNINNYVKDERYVRVYEKPVILIYRPGIIPDVQNLVQIWRREAQKIGLPGLYIIGTNAFGFDSPEDFGFDAVCEFPPHGLEVPEIDSRLTLLNPDYEGRVYEYADVVNVEIEKLTTRSPTALPRFPGVMVSWDNEARRPGKGHVFRGATPSLFHKWLNAAAEYATQRFPPEKRLVFINAWNEWAEGAYLEPDRRFGYANLAAVGNVVRRFNTDAAPLRVRAFDHNRTKTKSSETALCLHIFYQDLVTELAEALRKVRHQRPADVIVSIPESWSPGDLDRMVEEIKPFKVLVCANIGRDVWPFIQSLKICLDMGYVFGCKLHSKKSLHIVDGAEWRQRLFSGLLSEKALAGLESTFFADVTCGLAAPENSFQTLRDADTVLHNLENMQMLRSRLGTKDLIFEEFIAGNMFWFRFPALEKLAKLDIDATWFDEELSQIDGTMAHAFERIFVSVAHWNGYKVAKYTPTD